MPLPLLKFVLDFMFPRRCVGCGLGVNEENGHLCPSCAAQIKAYQPLRCAFCAVISAHGKTCGICRPTHSLDGLWAAANYDNLIVKKMVKEFKYRFIEGISEDMAKLILSGYGGKPQRADPVVVAVPLHRQRLHWRGFNQAESLALRLSSLWGVPYAGNALCRDKKVPPQADIEQKLARMKNIEGAFRVSDGKAAEGRNVYLIDDVATTGATLEACARELKGAGALSVTGVVFARGG